MLSFSASIEDVDVEACSAEDEWPLALSLSAGAVPALSQLACAGGRSGSPL